MELRGTKITQELLIGLGFEHYHTNDRGNLVIFRHEASRVFVGIDSEPREMEDRIGFYNTNTSLETIKEEIRKI